MHFCYALVAAPPASVSGKTGGGRRTYVGYTVDPRRRLRQHNREITGGARATRGARWHHVAVVAGFQTQQQGLQFEWAWKFWTRKKRWRGPTGRIRGLHHVLLKPRWTRQAPPAPSVPLRVFIRDHAGWHDLLRTRLEPPLPPHIITHLVPADAWWDRLAAEVHDPAAHGVLVGPGDPQTGARDRVLDPPAAPVHAGGTSTRRRTRDVGMQTIVPWRWAQPVGRRRHGHPPRGRARSWPE